MAGYGTDDAEAFVSKLDGLGIPGARILDGGAEAWSADPTLPIERLAHHESLVHIPWLKEVLAGGRPEAAPAGKALLFHVNFGVPEEYAEGHIPGALYLDTNWLEDPADWNRRSPAAIDAALRGARHHATTRRSSCTVATPRGTPTRSGRAVGPARSPRRAP